MDFVSRKRKMEISTNSSGNTMMIKHSLRPEVSVKSGLHCLWLVDQIPKWFPITRDTYLERLSIRFEREGGEPNLLAPVDIFVTTADPLKEPPILTANTVLSVLSV
ncbi:hypothetical protein JHK82_026865 [Glycine max]|nr:hypothetical protein JHK85_027489 [Glycine max]KAG5126030.1 hypothetical protein JHK82_026865 [Glycine max]